MKVKVSEINNLSDARYCAGMGVEMIGFSLDESNTKYIAPNKVTEIANWLTGIKVVGEFGKATSEEIIAAVSQLPLDYVQLNLENTSLLALQTLNVPKILKLEVTDLSNLSYLLRTYEYVVDYFLLEKTDSNHFEEDAKELSILCESYNIFLGYGISKENIDQIFNEVKPVGIELKGGIEIRPGLKDFEDLSEILDLLEQDEF